VAAAEVGSKVIVVEGDLRRPGLQAELMPEQPQPIRRGLSNYLAEGASLDEVVSPTSKPGIDIVAAGPLPPNPAALLESRRAHTLMRELGEVADLVIVDCPPLNIGADASVMAAAVDGVLLIVDLQTSTEDSVRHALDQLEGVRARILGLVVNRDRGEARGRYSYQYYTKGAAAETETAGASRE